MQLLLEQLINGASLGALYGLFGIGFGLVFATLGILNAAHGAYASCAAISAYFAITQLNLPFPAAVLVGVLAGGLIAVFVDQIAFQPLRSSKAGMLGALITSIAMWIILDTVAGRSIDHQSRAFPQGSFPGEMLVFGPFRMQQVQLLAILSLVVCTGAIYWLLRHTRTGAAMRAVGWNESAASLSGINSRAVVIVTALLAGATSGLAGVLGAAATSNVSPSLGEGLLLKGFAAVVVGGYSDIRGTALVGVLLGIVEVLVAQYVSTSLRDAVTYAALLVFLVWRPRGLFGAASVTRA